MKIAHISFEHTGGGAARAAYHLHSHLRERGVDSLFYVVNKSIDDASVEKFVGFFDFMWLVGRQRISNIVRKLAACRNNEVVSVNVLPSGLVGKINRLDADLIHLHWIGGDLLSLKEIVGINKPVVWTCHDCWPYLGLEHFPRAMNSNAFSRGYDTDGDAFQQWNRRIWLRKKTVFADFGGALIAPSQWVLKQLNASPLFPGANKYLLANHIDTDVFCSGKDQDQLRRRYQIPRNRFVVLFSAVSAFDDPRKGYQHLRKALGHLSNAPERESLYLLVCGAEVAGEVTVASFAGRSVGFVREENIMAELYALADVVVVPSEIETFGLVAAEALSCGTPVVAFETSGLIDIVDHEVNGYLASAFDSRELAKGIQWVKHARDLSESCVAKVHRCFHKNVVLSQTLDVYEKEIRRQRRQLSCCPYPG